jgi:hypothetical protein
MIMCRTKKTCCVPGSKGKTPREIAYVFPPETFATSAHYMPLHKYERDKQRLCGKCATCKAVPRMIMCHIHNCATTPTVECSFVHGTKLCHAQNCAMHKTVPCKKTVPCAKLCHVQNRAKHKAVLHVKMCHTKDRAMICIYLT